MEWSDYGQCFLMNKRLYGTGHILSYIGQYKILEPIGNKSYVHARKLIVIYER